MLAELQITNHIHKLTILQFSRPSFSISLLMLSTHYKIALQVPAYNQYNDTLNEKENASLRTSPAKCPVKDALGTRMWIITSSTHTAYLDGTWNL